MGLLDMVLSGENSSAISELAKNFGIDERDAKNAVSQMVPALSKGLKKNNSSAEGIASLVAALSKGNHQKYVNDPRSLTQEETVQDGNKILGHLLGSKDVSRNVAGYASDQTGLDAGILKKMLPMVAAMAMGALSQKSSALGLEKAQSASPQSGGGMDLFSSFLDSDGDGSVMDDLFGMAKKFF